MQHRTARLDPQSRATLVGFASRAVSVCACVLVAAPFGLASLHDVFAALPLACTLCALWALFRAGRAGLRPGVGGLNAWDESLAFNALACLGHAARHLPW